MKTLPTHLKWQTKIFRESFGKPLRTNWRMLFSNWKKTLQTLKYGKRSGKPSPFTKMHVAMTDKGFDPEDIGELEEIFARTVRDSKQGYIVEFHITRLAANDMIKEYINALMGDREAIADCMRNYAYIVQEIMDQVKSESD